ncbi:hypothetical protein D033_4671B, partial [Vibrio parahaemolyticus B-265]
EYGLIASKGG